MVRVTLPILNSIALIYSAVYLYFVDLANSFEESGSNSSSFAAINNVVAPAS
jgi:hypothetical protein